ncbi:TPA: hypothetical protein SAN82_003618 [Pseudomonas putida]|nr:hypothetical protein [Pseudomonas putida]
MNIITPALPSTTWNTSTSALQIDKEKSIPLSIEVQKPESRPSNISIDRTDKPDKSEASGDPLIEQIRRFQEMLQKLREQLESAQNAAYSSQEMKDAVIRGLENQIAVLTQAVLKLADALARRAMAAASGSAVDTFA